MATRAAYKRLTKEYATLQQNPTPYIVAKPLESNILEWHYVITGPPDSPYEGGEYHGKLNFPTEYPFKPPSIKMITPNGRFQTDFRLCLTMSDYHPNTWNPAWSVSTILTGLLSFMLEDTPTTGSVTTSRLEKVALAERSVQWNRQPGAQQARTKFREVWGELCTEEHLAEVERKAKERRDARNLTNGVSNGTVNGVGKDMRMANPSLSSPPAPAPANQDARALGFAPRVRIADSAGTTVRRTPTGASSSPSTGPDDSDGPSAATETLQVQPARPARSAAQWTADNLWKLAVAAVVVAVFLAKVVARAEVVG